MIRYLLDTNIASLFVRNGSPAVRYRMQMSLSSELAISAVTEAEMRFGMATKPAATRQNGFIDAFLREITVLPWDSRCAVRFATLMAEQQRLGKPLSLADGMIAAHASSYQLTLISNDHAFSFVPNLNLQDSTKGPQRA